MKLTLEEMQDLVKECDLDWQKGYTACDSANRYKVLIEAVIESLQGKQGKQVKIGGLVIDIIEHPLMPADELILMNPKTAGIDIDRRVVSFNKDYVAILIAKKELQVENPR